MTTHFVDKQLEEEVDHILMNAFSGIRKKVLTLITNREKRLAKNLNSHATTYTESRKPRRTERTERNEKTEPEKNDKKRRKREIISDDDSD
jgi:hypothetical protein